MGLLRVVCSRAAPRLSTPRPGVLRWNAAAKGQRRERTPGQKRVTASREVLDGGLVVGGFASLSANSLANLAKRQGATDPQPASALHVSGFTPAWKRALCVWMVENVKQLEVLAKGLTGECLPKACKGFRVPQESDRGCEAAGGFGRAGNVEPDGCGASAPSLARVFVGGTEDPMRRF